MSQLPTGTSLADGIAEPAEIVLALGVAFLLAYVVARLAGRFVRSTLTAIYSSGQDVARLVDRPARIAQLVIFVLALVVTALPALDAIGFHIQGGLSQSTALQWALTAGLRITLVVTIAWLIVRVVSGSTRRLELELARGADGAALDRARRAQTLGALLRSVSVVLVTGVTLLVVLRELSVDIMPMLTGAGIAGVALGFGAQWLVRDYIAGFFLILEDQIRVGDVVVINGQGGSVEAINLRTTVLRDLEGAVHVFQNGAITTLANRTRDYSYYLIDLTVDFRQDTGRVIDVLRETAGKLQQDEAFGMLILEPLEVLGVDAFRDGQVIIRSRIKTLPRRQWEVGRELRRRLLEALQQAGIELPPATLHSLVTRCNGQ
ncbi:MAG TPA: mechanosensitive ion channel family protein [Vicinamibacterales bacterium]